MEEQKAWHWNQALVLSTLLYGTETRDSYKCETVGSCTPEMAT